MTDIKNPEEVMQQIGITDPLERLVFLTAVISHFEAKCNESITDKHCERLLKESVEAAEQHLERLREINV